MIKRNGRLRCESSGVTREHGGLAHVANAQEEPAFKCYNFAFDNCACASVRAASGTLRTMHGRDDDLKLQRQKPTRHLMFNASLV